ncbi:MAG: DUF368 domain-containing protein [Chitinivibrionales bacterium]|nr:DUF368 domain-containing protein [Chitinivibrionales bacterium]
MLFLYRLLVKTDGRKTGKGAQVIALVKDVVVGFFIGLANIIPGVSGGTFLLIFGIYERVIAAVNNFKPAKIKSGLGQLLKAMTAHEKKPHWHAFVTFLSDVDALFLGRLLVGAAIAIVGLSSLMKWLLLNQFTNTYALFFGLILVSIVIPFKMLTEKKMRDFLFFLIGAALTVYVTVSVNPYDKAKAKSDHYQARYEAQQNEGAGDSGTAQKFSYIGKYTGKEFIYGGGAGALAVSAMVLPGISGSLVLILLGQYFEVISAISGMKTLYLDYFLFLGIFGVGMAAGLVLFAKLVNFVFKKFFNQTMAFLIGLMAGSLYTLWPFKQSILMNQYAKSHGTIILNKGVGVYTNVNQLPESMGQFSTAFICFVIGAGIMAFFARKEAPSAA